MASPLATIGDFLPVIDTLETEQSNPSAETKGPSTETPAKEPIPPRVDRSEINRQFRQRFTEQARREEGYTVDKPPVQWFVNQGVVLYNRQTKVLLKHQVIPFNDFGRLWYNADVCFARTHLLMESADAESPGEFACERKFGNKHQRLLSRHSYIQYMWNDSMIGMTGRTSRKVTAPPRHVADHISTMGNWHTQQADEFLNVGKAFPVFYVKVQLHTLRRPADMSIEDLVQQAGAYGLMEMYDLSTKRWGWFQQLQSFIPMVAGQPTDLNREQVETWASFLWKHFATYPIYIASHTYSPRSLRDRFGEIDHNSDYAKFIEKPVDVESMQATCALHDLSAETFHISVTDTGKESLNFVRHLLDTPARQSLMEIEGSEWPGSVV